jgi:hypothetical protein
MLTRTAEHGGAHVLHRRHGPGSALYGGHLWVGAIKLFADGRSAPGAPLSG